MDGPGVKVGVSVPLGTGITDVVGWLNMGVTIGARTVTATHVVVAFALPMLVTVAHKLSAFKFELAR